MENTANETRGQQLMQEADRKLNAGCGRHRVDDAMELFEKAAAQFKLAKNWGSTGEAYLRLAECAEKTGNTADAAMAYTHAGRAFAHDRPTEAMKTLRIAVEIRMQNNQFGQAAKLLEDIGGMEEKEANIKAAIKTFVTAADCYQADGNSAAQENRTLLKVADLSAADGDYDAAIKLYEKVVTATLASPILKYAVKEHQLRAGLCLLAKCARIQDMDELEQKLEKYKEENPSFDGDRGCKLLEDCMKAFEDHDVEAFTKHVATYDRVLRMNNLSVSLLLTVKRSFTTLDEPAETGNSGVPEALEEPDLR